MDKIAFEVKASVDDLLIYGKHRDPYLQLYNLWIALP